MNIIFPVWGDTNKVYPTRTLYDKELVDLHPLKYLDRDGDKVLYVIKDNTDITVYTKGGWGVSDNKEEIQDNFGNFLRSLKKGEYLIDFGEAIAKEKAIGDILYTKQGKKQKFFNSELWLDSPPPEIKIKQIAFSTRIKQFFHIGYNNAGGILDTIYLQGRAGKLSLPDNSKQTDYGKKLKLALLARTHGMNSYILPRIIDEDFVIPSDIKNEKPYYALCGDIADEVAAQIIEAKEENKEKFLKDKESKSKDKEDIVLVNGSIVHIAKDGAFAELLPNIKENTVRKLSLSNFLGAPGKGFDSGIICPSIIDIDFKFDEEEFQIANAIYIGNYTIILKLKYPAKADKNELEFLFGLGFNVQFLDELSIKTQQNINNFFFNRDKPLSLADINAVQIPAGSNITQ